MKKILGELEEAQKRVKKNELGDIKKHSIFSSQRR